jgi:hypothetical protein
MSQKNDLAESNNNHVNNASTKVGTFAVAMIIAVVAGVLAYNYPPMVWKIPEDLVNVGPLSSAEDQARLAVATESNLWRNSLIKFAMAGLGIGTCGLVLHLSQIAKRIPVVLVVLIVGLLSGLLAGAVGLYVRKFLNTDPAIPLLPESSRGLFSDIAVFLILNVFLLMPVLVLLRLQKDALDRTRGNAMLLAGLLSALVTIMIGAMMVNVTTSEFPPFNQFFIIAWFVAIGLSAILIFTFTGHKPKVGHEPNAA